MRLGPWHLKQRRVHQDFRMGGIILSSPDSDPEMQGLRKTNHYAVAGFLLPFMAAAVTSALLLIGGEDITSLKFSLPFVSVVPSLLLAGVGFSLKSIPLIPERGDKDYAYSGLTLNILFMVVFITSLFYVPSS